MKLRELLATVESILQLPHHPALAAVKGLTTYSHACQPEIYLLACPERSGW